MPAAPVTVAEFAGLARSVAADRARVGARWSATTRPTRWYAPAATGPGYEVWLLSWLPGPGQRTARPRRLLRRADRPARARCTERASPAARGRPRTSRRRPAGRSRPATSHDVVNDSLEPAVSLHVYFPGLTEMTPHACACRRASRTGLAAGRTARRVVDGLTRLGTMRIVVLAGGIGGARFLRGLKAAAPDADITVIGNTGDDIHLFGLKVCPDLDTVMYTLGGGIHEEQGWGRADETFAVKEELAAYGVGPEWFGLGDRDFATHIVRTQMLGAGYPLSAVTEALCARWQPGVRLIPMTDDRVETHVVVDAPTASARRSTSRSTGCGCAPRVPAAGGACRSARSRPSRPPASSRPSPRPTSSLFPPSNPVVTIGTILAVPGIREAIAEAGRAGRRPLPHRRRRAGARHGRQGARRGRRRVDRRGRRRALRLRAARRLARRHRRRRPGGARSRRPASAAAPCR